MKYHTIGSNGSEGKKSTFTIYADMDISQTKMAYTETDMKKVREELEGVQEALRIQTKRCRQLVNEYTKKLQQKEQQYQNEKSLRDMQLAKVLKALLIFEGRLKQEQKFISHQLNEKDYIIKKQNNDIQKLLASQYCKHCKQLFTPTLEIFDSSSEYVGTEHEYQSSNFESLDSSSETYATLSEGGYNKSESEVEEKVKEKTTFQKNKNNSQGRKKIPHRKSVGTYFEVLKLRNDSPLSNEDNTSADYDNLESLPPESVSDKISTVSESIGSMLFKSRMLASTASESSFNVSSSDCNKTVINNKLSNDSIKDSKVINLNHQGEKDSQETEKEKAAQELENKLTETIPVFEENGDANDNWYASASDQEDEEHRDIYRNNPVLECMNQILLQNMNDINSPPKTPNIERKTAKNNKKVKFCDEEEQARSEQNESTKSDSQHNYYETPIQKPPNFYETPQSIYSNDYEQILSRSNESTSEISSEVNLNKNLNVKLDNHYIVVGKESNEEILENNGNIVRKSKILRTPPALPPKPPNLLSKYKLNMLPKTPPSDHGSVDLEPDYCSISELNLPTKIVSGKKISVVAEVHSPTSLDIKNKFNIPPYPVQLEKVNKSTEDLTANGNNSNVPNLVMKKSVEKPIIQMAKHTSVKSEVVAKNQESPRKKVELEIPKLPQVSEIIIPDDSDEKEDDRISHDNYVKNNSQINKSKSSLDHRKPIIMGSTVSSLISNFNNQQILNEIKRKNERIKPEIKQKFSSFENLQNLDKHFTVRSNERAPETPTFENFDLSQNFEEFKLDDCEIEEYDVEKELNNEESISADKEQKNLEITIQRNNISSQNLLEKGDVGKNTEKVSVPNLSRNSIEILKKHLEQGRPQIPTNNKSNVNSKKSGSPNYEHFLECTGLSSKSILTPSRMLSNHKFMLKPKDVKLRSKVRANAIIFERQNGTNKKYWSEPFV